MHRNALSLGIAYALMGYFVEPTPVIAPRILATGL